MKRICILLFMMLSFMLVSQAQTTITVVGTVVCNGQPVPNATGTFQDSLSGISGTMITDSLGNYSFSYQTNSTQGSITAAFAGPGGSLASASNFYSPGRTFIQMATIDICSTGGGGGNCIASFFTNQSVFNPLMIMFNDISSSGNPAIVVSSWSWDFGDGNTSTSQNPTHTYARTGTYNVCLVITAGTCTDSTCQTVTIGATPCSADFFFQQGAGNQVFFSNGSTGGTAPYTYSWSFGDGNSSTTQNPTHTYSLAGTYNVCLVVTDASGCVDSTCKPVIVANNNTPCQAGFTYGIGALGVIFTNTSQGTIGGQNTYNWSFGDGNTSTAQNPTHSYASPGTYTVCLYLTSTGGGAVCRDTVCQSVTIQGNPMRGSIFGQVFKANAGVANAKVWLIEYDSVAGTLTAIDSAITGNTPIFGQGYYQFSNVAAGSYRIKAALQATDPDYWSYLPTYSDTALVWNQAGVITLPVNATATANVNLRAGTNPGGPGFIGGLISQGANKRDPGDPIEDVHVYLLNNNDQPVAYALTDANGEFTFSNLAYGTYRVHVEILGKTYTDQFVTISAASSSATNVNFEVNSTNIDVTTSLEPSFGTLSRVYPNPTQGWVKLELSLDKAVNLEIVLTDLMGRSFPLQRKALPAGDHQLDVEVERFSTGIYFLNVKAENQTISYKLIVE